MIKETIERVKSETPDYFKKVLAIAVGMVTVATVIIGISTQVFIPDNVIRLLSNFIVNTPNIFADHAKHDHDQAAHD